MSAVRREQPVRLPTDRGVGLAGALVTDASTEQLEACLRADNAWLYGGEMVVDGDATRVTGFLRDPTLNPGNYETGEAYLANTEERTANHRAVRRVVLRIQAIEAELGTRREQQHAEATRRRSDALARLTAWRANAQQRTAEFQAAAEQAVRDLALLAPIVEALERLQSLYPSDQGNICAVYARLRAHDREIDELVDPLNCNYAPLPDLPANMPTQEQVRRASNVLRTTEWADSRVPATGLERLALARTLRDARGES